MPPFDRVLPRQSEAEPEFTFSGSSVLSYLPLCGAARDVDPASPRRGYSEPAELLVSTGVAVLVSTVVAPEGATSA